MRNVFKNENELKLNDLGLCNECAEQLNIGTNHTD